MTSVQQPIPPISSAPARRSGWLGRPALWVTLIGIVLTITLSLVLWNNVFKERFIARNWGVVEPNSVYRSGQLSRYLVRDTLKANDINVVIFLSIDKPNRPDVEAEVAACRELGIERYNFPLEGDGTGDVNQYAGALVLLARCVEKKKRVLVHCHAGAQRTGGLIFAYRTLVQHMDAEKASREMNSFGHDSDDNPRLVPYLNDHMDELAEVLVKDRIINSIPAPLPVAVGEP